MTLKTTGGKVAYWTISWTVIVATLVLSIIYSASTHMRSAIFATDIDGRVYTVDDKGSCGKHTNDIWCLYDENGDPEEYSIRANQVDYEERCAYYAELRARKAWKKAHPNQTRFTYRSW